MATTTSTKSNGRKRVVITNVHPEIDCGHYPIKRCQDETVRVQADIISDGHDTLSGYLLYRHAQDKKWHETPLTLINNDRWEAEFTVTQLGYYEYTVIAWVDSYRSWKAYFHKKLQANQDVPIELKAGAELITKTAQRANKTDRDKLLTYAKILKNEDDLQKAIGRVWDERLQALLDKYPERRFATQSKILYVWVDRPKAQFSSWYELFPRSWSKKPGKHGTFLDIIEHLPYIAEMGFDVIYFPPIHPIAHTKRKGRNNRSQAEPGDPGSPWAIGSEAGGHKSVHPELGTLNDLHQLVKAAQDYRIEIALDIALQCSPDHPYLKEHPQWFSHRPDGSLRYAENPPKKYEDIYPIDFMTTQWKVLWDEIKSVFLFWIEQGIKIFRVDNPHTKPFAFWEWLIAEVRRDYPEVIFLSEAFTRPKVMYHLAKIGFTQSYTYFTWRNTPEEMRTYLQELTQTQVREYFRPNFWPNTPDILHAYLQTGGRPAFIVRLILAATLSTNYGLYGPAYELCVNTPREPSSEEYLNSEKYEIKQWSLNTSESIRPIITKMNQIRRDNQALQQNWNLTFHNTDNPKVLCYSKSNKDNSNVILVLVNFDVFHTQSGWTTLDLNALGIERHSFVVYDLLSDTQYTWHGHHNYFELNPAKMPAHVFLVRGT